MRKGSDAATGHLWSVSITQGSVHQNPQNYPWDSYHFPLRSEETKAEHGQGSCYKVTALPPEPRRAPLGYRALRPQGKQLPLYGMCPHIQDEAWNPQCFRKAKRKCHICCLQKLVPAAHLLQRGIRAAQPGARRGVGAGSRGPAFAPLQKQNHLQQFALHGTQPRNHLVLKWAPGESSYSACPASSSSPSPEDDTLGPGYPLGGPAGQAFPVVRCDSKASPGPGSGRGEPWPKRSPLEAARSSTQPPVRDGGGTWM